MLLSATTHTLELKTSAAQSLDWHVEWADHTATDATLGDAQGNVATATSTVIVAAPAASTQRQVKYISLRNRGTATNTIQLVKDVAGTEYLIGSDVALLPGEAVIYTISEGHRVYDGAGRIKSQASDVAGASGRTLYFYKIGTAPEAAGNFYCWAKDTGGPGAWSPGSPGLNGRATDGTAAGDAGCLSAGNAAGAHYVSKFELTGTVAHHAMLADVLWVNTGLVVTTTTAQALTPAALPARDINGSTNGEGVLAALLVTAATTNGAAFANCTISYTNSDGTAGRTGTMASFPATAVIGTIVLFELAAGDKGVRSVQSVTLGTSLVTGSVSLILMRVIQSAAVLLANAGSPPRQPANPGTRIHNGHCLLPMGVMSGTGAVTITGTVEVMDR